VKGTCIHTMSGISGWMPEYVYHSLKSIHNIFIIYDLYLNCSLTVGCVNKYLRIYKLKIVALSIESSLSEQSELTLNPVVIKNKICKLRTCCQSQYISK
jgi:hypothetical protein